MNDLPPVVWWSTAGGFIGSVLIPFGPSGVLFGTAYGFVFGLVAAKLAPALVDGLRSIATPWVRGLLGLAVLAATWWVNSLLITGIWLVAAYVGPLGSIRGLHIGAALGVTFAVAVWVVRQSREAVRDPA